MKFYEMGLVLKHPWEQVVQSFWQRYPNPYRLAESFIFRTYFDFNLIILVNMY